MIWIDLENTPHVPFFKPIIAALEKRGYTVTITTRDAYQTRELADFHGLSHTCIGKHSGKKKILKIIGILSRAVQLAYHMKSRKPCLAICHGSRSQLIAAKLLHIKSVLITDYEYVFSIPLVHFSYRIVPAILADTYSFKYSIPTFTYHGIKEDVYVPFFKPRENLFDDLHLSEGKIIITVRPPATEAHYYVAASGDLFIETMDFLLSRPGLSLILLPRSSVQRHFIASTWSEAIRLGHIVMPARVLDGLELIWISDLVISGGGTMNREAAALGVPVYSIFRGQIGAVDQYLHQQGKLCIVKNKADLHTIKLEKRDKNTNSGDNHAVLEEIVDHIQHCVQLGIKAGASNKSKTNKPTQ